MNICGYIGSARLLFMPAYMMMFLLVSQAGLLVNNFNFNVTVTAGETLILECLALKTPDEVSRIKANGQVEAQIRWFKSDGEMTGKPDNVELAQSEEPNTRTSVETYVPEETPQATVKSIVKIKQVELEDSGNYTCCETSTSSCENIRRIREEIWVHVQVTADIQTPERPISENNSSGQDLNIPPSGETYKSQDGINALVPAVAVVAVIVLIGMAAAVIFVVWKRRQSQSARRDTGNDQQQSCALEPLNSNPC